MLNPEIISLNIGKPEPLLSEGREVLSSIKKKATSKPLFLSKEQIDGDDQADKVNHGGLDKAICVYPFEHYTFWERELGKKLELGAFGENLTVKGLIERDVHVGDLFQWGNARVQVSQPRIPCHKLASRFQLESMPKHVIKTGFTGFYFRVLNEGTVSSNMPMKFIKRYSSVSVTDVNDGFYKKQGAIANKIIINTPELAASWKQMMNKE
ncbi:MOSC domain-containing protein [Salipaludibacillus daqingensis]|uniref:MOSC domain-containing protein n=1 Tax=Salipaludibacillus daqingensis TaxID=3041001 RepID=UPI002473C8C7|nr:MOSC domain-containing protein [Salipaludibacillus daqingensis]